MVISRLFVFLLFFSQFTFADYYIRDNNIYKNSNIVNTSLVKDELGSLLLDNKRNFTISNSYNASSQTKSELNYIFDKLDGKLLKIEKIDYSVLYGIYYGYVINISNGLSITEINESYIDKINSLYGFKDYSLLKDRYGIGLSANIGNKDIFFKFHNNKKIFMIDYDLDNDSVLGYKYVECKLLNDVVDYSLCNQVGFVNKKSYLYSDASESTGVTKMYLVKGDQVLIKNVKISQNEKWYFINYKGKKNINMWLKADSVDLN
ncbi:hypothetical protein HYE53_06385 [Aggregatibacter actinomycetemcomitans]|uniref:hypothetical protein n=1 Tax=Aggregatibacter actinomycetemcomitans TaxID=714 RepID=UPI00197C18F8|nr:hypothetical protein [Aggregatibacter actinomycetemcomitans]MBN6070717.1 hypothetical protein [Aggregatibacter actinomycetemcomitans]